MCLFSTAHIAAFSKGKPYYYTFFPFFFLFHAVAVAA